MELMIVSLLLILVAMLRLTGSRCADLDMEEHRSSGLGARLEEFLEQDRFVLLIQPVVDLHTGRVCCGEVLTRLDHPERGLVSPGEFIPAIDAAGLHARFDRYVFEKACAWLSGSLAEGDALEHLSCNFSRKTICDDTLAGDLIAIADRCGLPRGKLAIEITEWQAETDCDQFHRTLQQLKAGGFRIFLDDYGSGATSVKDLMRYPLDVVKTDGSILLEAETERGRAAYRALVAMAAEVGAEVTCEGIETEAQWLVARESGCRYGQGYLFCRPMDPAMAHNMMGQHHFHPEET